MSNKFNEFGFALTAGSAHGARTMMLKELIALFEHLEAVGTTREEYLIAINEENCLSKRSSKTRSITASFLKQLYALDPEVTIFKALRYLWQRDEAGRPLIALLCVYSRDSLFRPSASFILSHQEGAVVKREALEEYLEGLNPGRLSAATLKSTAQNINSTWTQTGHLKGKVKKLRSRAEPTAGSVAYALLLGHLKGVRGELLFETDYAKILDCSVDKLIELAELASRRGWIIFKKIGNVIDVQFPALLNEQEQEWIREQN